METKQRPDLLYGNCLELMRDIPDRSVDMILTDPPYGVLHKGNPNAKWDIAVPFDSLWEQWERIIKPNGVIVVFGQGMFTAKLMTSNPKMWRYNLVWDKRLVTGFLNAKKMPLRRHEDICVFYKQRPTYNPQMSRCDPHRRNHQRGKNVGVDSIPTNRNYGRYYNTPTVMSDEKYPTSIISIAKQHPSKRTFHPTEKPIDLLRWLIRTFTNDGDIVLDCFMGCGSTGVACKREHRRFVGIEKEKEFYDIAVMRCESEVEQLKLNFDIE